VFVSREGSPTEAIIDEARRCQADVIVVEEAMPWLPRWAHHGGARHLHHATRSEVVVVGQQGVASTPETSTRPAA